MPISLDTLRDLPTLEVAAGETVIEQGSRTGKLFILIEGKLEIVKDGELVAVSNQPGDIFGDLSALLGTPHTTSVRAVTPSRFYVAPEARALLEKDSVICLHLCELLARRLVSVTDYLVTIKEQYVGHDHIGMVDQLLDKLLHRHPRARVAPRSSTAETPE